MNVFCLQQHGSVGRCSPLQFEKSFITFIISVLLVALAHLIFDANRTAGVYVDLIDELRENPHRRSLVHVSSSKLAPGARAMPLHDPLHHRFANINPRNLQTYPAASLQDEGAIGKGELTRNLDFVLMSPATISSLIQTAKDMRLQTPYSNGHFLQHFPQYNMPLTNCIRAALYG